jgi:hypothetical protein
LTVGVTFGPPQGMNKIYGTEFMAKSLTFIWEPYYGVDTDSHGKVLKELAELVNAGKIKSYLQKSLRLDLNRLRKSQPPATRLLRTYVSWRWPWCW